MAVLGFHSKAPGAASRFRIVKQISVLSLSATLLATAPGFGATATNPLKDQDHPPASHLVQSRSVSENHNFMQMAQLNNASQPVVTFQNNSQYPIDVLYADENGAYQLFQTMQPGGRAQAQVPVGFTFVFGYNGSTLLGQYQLTNQPQQFLALDNQTLVQAGVNAPQAAPTQRQAPTGLNSQPPSMAITNNTGVQVDLLYQDQNGQYALAQSIAPGQQLSLGTRSGDTWYFSAANQIIAQYQANGGTGQPIILEPSLIAQQGGIPGQVTPGQFPPGNTNASAGANGPRQLPQVQAPAAPATVDFNTGPKVNVQTAASNQNSGAITSKTPVRANWNAQTWAAGTKDMYIFATGSGNGFMQTNPDGSVIIIDQKDASSAANWYLEKIEGSASFYLRNAAQVASYLYIDPSTNGLMFGPQGLNLPTGIWRSQPHPLSAGISFLMNEGVPGMALVARNGRVGVEALQITQNTQFENGWLADTVPNWKEFLGSLMSLVPAFQQMEQNIAQLEADYARQQQEARIAAEAKAQADRVALLAFPYTAQDPNDTGYFWMHPGQFPVEVKNGRRGITYDFSKIQMPDLYQTLYQMPKVGDSATDTTMLPGNEEGFKNVDRRIQSAHLNLKPEAYVFEENGIAYARFKTGGISGVEMRSDGLPSSQFETDSTYYLSSANMSIWANVGQVDFWWPANENTSTGTGSNTDTTTSINLSSGDFGGDSSTSKGESVDRQIDDYQVKGYSNRGGASYDWTGCGLATTQEVTDYCLYRSATDMFDEETFSLLAIKPIATSMTLMQTDSVFRLGPVSNLPDKINLAVYVSAKLDAAAIRPADRSTGDQFLNDAERGFSIFWTTEAWERMFESDERKNARAFLEAVAAYDTAGFRIVLELDISQLK